MRDPFLADALEGAGLIAAEDFTNDIKILTLKLEKEQMNTKRKIGK
ncbi:MAG: hypothetical protein IPJ20_21925 [Flammeovirgaceae bacterium]|nr:hypothetical protein [Flammeovirgaceae bacterium]